ncbi:16528_t:CDS:2, partial [Racocetra persica]
KEIVKNFIKLALDKKEFQEIIDLHKFVVEFQDMLRPSTPAPPIPKNSPFLYPATPKMDL